MYPPSDDTFLLADCASQYSGKWALEIGVGSGFLTKLLAERFENVVGSDINLDALKYCKNQINAMLVCCDAAYAFVTKFDLIISNPPYLPDDQIKDPALHGGPAGIEKTMHFVKSAIPLLTDSGKILIVMSSLADSSELDLLVNQAKLKKRIIKEKDLFYERLSVLELQK